MSRVFDNAVKDIRFQPMYFNGCEFNVACSGWSKRGGFDEFFDLDTQVNSLSSDALRAQRSAELDGKLFGLI